ncbi:Coatomer subunit beta' (CopB') [Blattamonas nauphoetae]|uniref:Coatomer subunit beta' n=1 Tax=Blattamonas nauphoetae TaxID=2049346 RepID=A0ABQ9YCG0_9EUKA|nr:Coatomer subunit beta' (CopB') [Blattamonas nauphoetae]
MSALYKKTFVASTDKVKSLDIHPTRSLILTTLYNGSVLIWDFEKKILFKTIDIGDKAIRCGKFIPAKNWFVVGADDKCLRIYHLDSGELVKKWEAHDDFIRSIAIHPTKPYILSSSDDYTSKLWDYEKGFSNVQVYQGHEHFVMSVAFNPKDPTLFASSSVDGYVKVWTIGSSAPLFSILAHERGSNFVAFYPGADRAHLISCGDDHMIKVWDFQTKAQIIAINAHTQNVSFAAYHPDLPLVISGSEDGEIKIWNSSSFRLLDTIDPALGAMWGCAFRSGLNKVACGGDEGVVMLKLGHEKPTATMDYRGQLYWAKKTQLEKVTINANARDGVAPPTTGEQVECMTKSLVTTEYPPTSIATSPSGKAIAVVIGDDFVIYTARAAKNVSFGKANEIVWATGFEEELFATLEFHDEAYKRQSRIKIHPNYETQGDDLPIDNCTKIFGGLLLGAFDNEAIHFIDWQSGYELESIEGDVKEVAWSANGKFVSLICRESIFVLAVNQAVLEKRLENPSEDFQNDDESLFEVVHEELEQAKRGVWSGECFIFQTKDNRLMTLVGDLPTVVAHIEPSLYLLGYVKDHNSVYLVDKQHRVMRYPLLGPVVDLQIAVHRQKTDEEIQTHIFPLLEDSDELCDVAARFLSSINRKELALLIAKDVDLLITLSLETNNIGKALSVAEQSETQCSENETTEEEGWQAVCQRWKKIGDFALQHGMFGVSERCFAHGRDLESLFVQTLATGDKEGLAAVGGSASMNGDFAVAFYSLFMQHRVDECLDLLSNNDMVAEAAFFARSYAPWRVAQTVTAWETKLAQDSPHFKKAPSVPSAKEGKQ